MFTITVSVIGVAQFFTFVIVSQSIRSSASMAAQ